MDAKFDNNEIIAYISDRMEYLNESEEPSCYSLLTPADYSEHLEYTVTDCHDSIGNIDIKALVDSSDKSSDMDDVVNGIIDVITCDYDMSDDENENDAVISYLREVANDGVSNHSNGFKDEITVLAIMKALLAGVSKQDCFKIFIQTEDEDMLKEVIADAINDVIMNRYPIEYAREAMLAKFNNVIE